MDDTLDFLIPADYRVEFAVPGGAGQVNAQLVEGWSALAGAGTGAAAAGSRGAEDAVGFGADFFEGNAEAFENAGGHAFAFSE